MSAAEIGAGGSSYTGNADLGGSNAGVIKIDTAPLAKLNDYAFLYNKAMWEQKTKEQDALVTELAKASSLDLNSLIPEEKKQALAKYDELNQFAADIAKKQADGSLGTVSARLQWQDKLKKTSDFFDIANTRYKSKASREEQIAKETNPERKAFLQKRLDQDIKSTTIEQPIPSLQSFDLTAAKIDKPKMQQIGVAVYGDNSDFIREDTHTLPDQKSINAQAASIELGLKALKVDKTSQEYLSKSPEQKKIIDDQQEQFEASDKLAEAAASDHYNAALKQYTDKDGNIDINAARAKNGVLAGVFDTIDAYNAYMLDMQQKIRAGVYKGTDGVNQLDEKDYQPISYADGNISVQDLVKPKILAMADESKVVPKVTQSDNKIQGDTLKQAKELAVMKENREDARNKYTQGQENYRAKLAQEGQNARATAKTANGATTAEGGDFGNLLYSVNSTTPVQITHNSGLKVDANLRGGALVGADGNPVNYTGVVKVPLSYFDNSIATEYNKYIGKPDENGDLKSVVGKLQLSGKNYVAQFENGVIKGLFTEDGTLASDNQFAHITQMAGQAGVTKYKKPDTNYGKTDNVSNDGDNETFVAGGKAYTKKDLKGMGYTDDQIEEAIRLGNVKKK